VAAITPLLARAGGETHDPEVLVARLQGLARGGVPVVVESRRLSSATREAFAGLTDLHRPVRVIPHERDGHVIGVKVYGVRAGSPIYEAGGRNGDLVLAVNGVPMDDRAWPGLYPFPGESRAAVIELERAGELRVLVIRW
jgi:hypothetical protein